MTTSLSKSDLLAGTLPPGTRLRNYQLLSHLATGGMAELYLARAVGIASFERLVVVKRILPQWARDPQFVAMFLDEARLAAQLSHPNIAQVFDIGEESGAYFFTMEFVHGEDMRAVLRLNQQDGERLPLEIAISSVIETASALHHAHEATDADGVSLQLVHRDVSPSNVLMSYDGAIKVVDFGIAKAANRQQETRTGCLKGKVAYMAPEQCLGQEFDRRADVFALGILLYETTTGRKCFDAPSDFTTLEKITTGDFVPPSEYVEGYPDELESIVRRALALDREIRYQSAESLATHLEVFAAKHGLPLSRRHRGRYMRERFADKLEAWEFAQSEGESLANHLADSRIFSLTPSGVMPVGSASGVAADSMISPPAKAPVFSETRETAAAPPRRRMALWLAIVATAALTAVLVLLIMPKLGWGPWDTSSQPAAAPVDSERNAEADRARAAAAEAEARATAAEERAKREAAARAEVERIAAAKEAQALAAAEAAEAEQKERRRARRKKRRSNGSSSSTTKRKWQANSPLLPSQSKKKK